MSPIIRLGKGTIRRPYFRFLRFAAAFTASFLTRSFTIRSIKS